MSIRIQSVQSRLKQFLKDDLLTGEKEALFLCLQRLSRKEKTRIYLVGGYLRDFLLAKQCVDFDFAVDKNAVRIATLFARKIKGAFVLLDKERGCARVIKKVEAKIITFDFSDFRKKDLKGDLGSRDFTINAFCVDLAKAFDTKPLLEILIDSKKSLADLKAKEIRMTSPGCFKEDPLRLVRAFSLQAILGFKIEKRTLNLLKKESRLIHNVSPERIRDEFFKVLAAPKAAQNLKEMDNAGLLREVIPQITVMYNIKQGTYHHLDVWPHSLETVYQLEKLFEELRKNEDIMRYLAEPFAGSRTRGDIIKFSALLHDIGKPDAKRRENRRTIFHGHEHIGRSITRKIAFMLKLSTKERHAAEDMVMMHLRPGYLSNFKKPSQRSIFRFFRDGKDESVSILLLSWADQRSTCGPLTTEADQKHHENVCKALIKKYFEKKKEKPFIRLINGHDLIKKLKLKPSPLFTKILQVVEENQVLGKIKTKKEALSLAEKAAKKKVSKKLT